VFDFKNPGVHTWPGTAARASEITDGGVIRSVVNHNIIAWLKEAHLANLFGAHARSRDVCHRARSKFESRVRSIYLVSQNWNADGMQRSHLDIFSDQPLHDVQIVNHQVQDHIYVQRARSELTDTMDFEIDRVAHVRPQRDQRGIESCGVTELQKRAGWRGGSDH